MTAAWLAIAGVLGASAPALADGGSAPVGEPPDGNPTYHPNYVSPDRAIVITTPADHSSKDIAISASIAAVGVVLSGIAVYYNLDSRSAANSVSAAVVTGQPWTATDQASYDRAHDSAVKAGVFYGIGGAAIAAAIVTWIVSTPPNQTVVIHPHSSAPTVTPTPGGALVGGTWSF